MYFPSPCEFIAVSLIVFVETGAAGSHVLLQICHCCESPGAANEGMDVVSKISWTHLRHRCCLSHPAVACCLFVCTWSYGFCHALACSLLHFVFGSLCLSPVSFGVCLFPLFFPSPPHLGVLLLVVVSWLFVGCKTSFTVAAISIRSTWGGDWGRARGATAPNPT